MKISVRKMKYVKIFVISILFIYILLKNSIYGIINYDDYRFIGTARDMISEDGFLHTLYYSFFNMDLGNEYRTYGLLRVFTVFWALLFGYNQVLYGFMLGAVHCLSSVAIYFVSLKAFQGKIGEKRSLLIAGIWLMNPFSSTQSMHHMLYILMPAYLFILLLLVDLSCKKYKYIIEFILAIGVVFFGENMIIPLYFFLAVRVWQNKKKLRLCEGYIFIAISVLALLLGHYFHYRIFRYSPDMAERFSAAGLAQLTLPGTFESIINILMQNTRNALVIWNKFDLGYVRTFQNIIKCMVYLVFSILLYRILSFNCSEGKPLSRKDAIFAFTLCFSTYGIYLILQILGSGGFNSRYMLVCVPSILIGGALLFFRKSHDNSLCLLLVLFCCLGLSWFVHYDIMLDYVGDINRKIIDAVKQGEKYDKSYVIFANAYPNSGLNAQECALLREPGMMTDSEQFYSVYITRE